MGFLNSLFGGKSKTTSEIPPEIIAIMEKIRKYMEDEDLQNSNIDPSRRDMVTGGLAVDELPDGVGEFGRSAENPIPVNGVMGELIYLSRLMTNDTKQRLLFHRIGSVNAIDVYETVSIDGRNWDILFLSLYHPRKSRKAPAGYQIADSKSQPLIYGTNRRVSQFPVGLQKAIAATTEELIGVSLAPSEVRQAEEEIVFRRPDNHERRGKTTSQIVAAWRE